MPKVCTCQKFAQCTYVAGEDRIQAKLLTSGGSAVIDWLTELLQEVYRTRQEHGSGRLQHLYHSIKRTVRSVTITYHGVTLLSVPSKALALSFFRDCRLLLSPNSWKPIVALGKDVAQWIRLG